MKTKTLMKSAKAGNNSKVVSEKSGKVMKAKKLGSGLKKSIAKKSKSKDIISHTLENAKVNLMFIFNVSLNANSQFLCLYTVGTTRSCRAS
jgi:hypothetical protein